MNSGDISTIINVNMSNGSGDSFGQPSDGNCKDVSKTSLIVNYLPQTMTQEEVRSLFAIVGELESCKLIRDKVNVTNGDLRSPLITGHSLGYAFVNFMRAEDAEKAINTLNGLRLQNKTIKVSFARPSSDAIKGANLYVSGLNKNLAQDELEALFRPFGLIITSRILYDNINVVTGENIPGISKGVGFIRFDQRQEAERAIQELNGTIPSGSTERLTVKFANNPGSNNKSISTLGAYPRHFSGPVGPTGPIHNVRNTGRFRYSPLGGASNSTATDHAQGNDGTGWCIFIYNLAPETEDSMLWQLFGPFGAVLSVKVIRDMQTNECKGFGFVTMANYDDAVVAIQALNGYMVGNRVLQVSFKVNKPNQTKARIRL